METDIFTNIKIIIYEVKVYKNDKATHFYYNFFFQKVGQSFLHLSHRKTVTQDLLVRRQFSLVQDNRTNVNVKA